MAADGRVIRCLVSGRVQGVFFRAATLEQAQLLGVVGWVRNLPDGCVEIVASGSRDALDRLTIWLWQGPARARVNSVSVEEWSGEPPGDQFRIC